MSIFGVTVGWFRPDFRHTDRTHGTTEPISLVNLFSLGSLGSPRKFFLTSNLHPSCYSLGWFSLAPEAVGWVQKLESSAGDGYHPPPPHSSKHLTFPFLVRTCL